MRIKNGEMMYKLSNEFDNGIEQGMLPDDWEFKSFGDILVESKFKFRDLKHSKELKVLSLTRKEGLIPQEKRFKQRIATKDISKYKLAKKGWLVYNPYVIWEGAIHSLKKSDSGLVSPVYLVWKVKNADPDFIDYISKTSYLIRQYNKFAAGAVNRRRSIKKNDFLSIKIPFPKINEQRKISLVLSTIQEDIENIDKIIETTKYLKKSIMNYLFTYGPVNVNEAKNISLQETEIGMMHEGWKILPIKDIAKIKSGGTPSRKKPEYWNGEIPWLKTGEINYNIITETEEKISLNGLENSSAKMIPKGTLLMAMYGQGATRGRVAILGIDASINQACAAIFPSKIILTDYLFYFLNFNYEKIRNMGHGSHQKNLSAALIKTIPVAIPNSEDQVNIVRILQIIDAKIQSELKNKIILQELFKTLLNNLMTAKIRVNNLEV